MASAYVFANCRRRRTKCARLSWHGHKENRMSEAMPAETIRCDACPVLCYIKRGYTGACDRYANHDGQLVRVDPHLLLDRAKSQGTPLVPFLEREGAWDGKLAKPAETFLTAIGAGTTYPDYKPAPFIVSSEVDGVDLVTVVTEGIFSYCGVKLKIDTDRHLGPERNLVRAQGEPVGHVSTAEYGSQMLSLGGVHHLTGGTKSEGRVTCETLLDLCNGKEVALVIDNGASITVAANQPPIVNGQREERMRVGCGSAAIGMFAKQWSGKVDDVVVVDDHITGVLSEHQAGKMLGVRETGIAIRGRRSTPGRYFQVAQPGTGWGGTSITDPLSILKPFKPNIAWPHLRLLMVSTTGEHYAYYELDDSLRPVEKALPAALQESVARIRFLQRSGQRLFDGTQRIIEFIVGVVLPGGADHQQSQVRPSDVRLEGLQDGQRIGNAGATPAGARLRHLKIAAGRRTAPTNRNPGFAQAEHFSGLVLGKHAGDMVVHHDDIIDLAGPLLREHANRRGTATHPHAFLPLAIHDRRLICRNRDACPIVDHERNFLAIAKIEQSLAGDAPLGFRSTRQMVHATKGKHL